METEQNSDSLTAEGAKNKIAIEGTGLFQSHCEQLGVTIPLNTISFSSILFDRYGGVNPGEGAVIFTGRKSTNGEYWFQTQRWRVSQVSGGGYTAEPTSIDQPHV